jgi:GTP-binding protein
MTKADAMTPEQIKSQKAKLKRACGQTPYLMSSHSGQGVQDTLRALMQVIDGVRDPAEAEKEEAAWQP